MSVDIMEKLKAMAGDEVAVKSKASKLRDAVKQAAIKQTGKPKAVEQPPAIRIAESAIDPTPVEDEDEDDRLIRKAMVVVLDDGDTYSNIEGARLCFIPEGSDDLPEGAYDSGIPIKDLVVLRDAIKTVVGICKTNW